jgi:glycosyltransferase involved in cell wall biosynthesis
MNNPVQWNTLIGHLSSLYRTVVVLHSVYEHKDKLVFEAPCNEIIVHSLLGRETLIQKGITHAPIHYIPHGCIPPIEMDLKWSTLSNKPVVFQFGFGFEYKGWGNANTIIEKLKEEFSDITYIGVFNVSKFCAPMQTLYHASLMKSIRDKNLQNNVVLHRGFRSEEVLFSYMRQAKVNLFPYWNHFEWLVHGASGAVRLALASGTPTIVGDVPFFDEFKGYIPVCSEPEQYVEEIKRLLKEPAYCEEIKTNMHTFITERTWDKVAGWYLACTPDKPFDAPVGAE